MNNALLITSLIMSTIAIAISVLMIVRMNRKHKLISVGTEKPRLEQVVRASKLSGASDAIELIRDQDALLSELLNDPNKLDYRKLGRDYESIASLLNHRAETINPEAITSIPKHVSMYDLIDIMEPDEALELYRTPGLKADIENAISLDNRNALVSILQVAAAILSDATIRKIQSILSEQEADPGYSNTIKLPSRAEQVGLLPLNPGDVQMVLHNVRW